jgi:hypothetical protein
MPICLGFLGFDFGLLSTAFSLLDFCFEIQFLNP